TVIFHDGRTFLLRVGPNDSLRPFDITLASFDLFNLFKSRRPRGVLNILNIGRSLQAAVLQLSQSSAPAVHLGDSVRRGDTSQSRRGRPCRLTPGCRTQPAWPPPASAAARRLACRAHAKPAVWYNSRSLSLLQHDASICLAITAASASAGPMASP